uniref:Uncharacterized protein n=1 Tax=Sphaerodactylus townsendi TaxID=933632 RepID=A0ACB8E5R6_9SAUR
MDPYKGSYNPALHFFTMAAIFFKTPTNGMKAATFPPFVPLQFRGRLFLSRQPPFSKHGDRNAFWVFRSPFKAKSADIAAFCGIEVFFFINHWLRGLTPLLINLIG